jgi:3-isopropylmalate dehydrogenase
MRLAIIPGDGVGKEVTTEALKVLRVVSRIFGRPMETEMFPFGADHYLETGVALSREDCTMLGEEFDAVFIGALGDPRIPDMRHAREILQALRLELDLYVTLRPVTLLDAGLCPLRNQGPADVNFVILRESAEGTACQMGGRFRPGTEDEIAVDQDMNTFRVVQRLIRHAFHYANEQGMAKLCMARKGQHAHGRAVWDRAFAEVAACYPEIEATALDPDTLLMQMIRRPSQFDVVLTDNLSGDIVSAAAAQLQGGAGVAASALIHPERTCVYMPVHGPAQADAGRNVANPIGAIASAALMLEVLGCDREAKSIELAARHAISTGNRPIELGGSLGTRETGDDIVAALFEVTLS